MNYISYVFVQVDSIFILILNYPHAELTEIPLFGVPSKRQLFYLRLQLKLNVQKAKCSFKIMENTKKANLGNK